MSAPLNEHDDALIDRYLNGKLSSSECAAFEIRLLDEPPLLQQLQLAEAMQAAMKRELPSLLAESDKQARAHARIIPFVQWIQQPLSLAATLLVAILGLQLGHNKAPQGPTEKPADGTAPKAPLNAIAVGSLVQLEAARGDQTVRTSGKAPYLFKMDAGIGNDGHAFVFTLKDAAGNAVLTQPDVIADAEGWVRVVVNGELGGNYTATLDWTDAGGAAQQRNFSVVVEAPTAR